MEKIVLCLMAMLMTVSLYAAPSRTGGKSGLVVGTQAQETASGVTVGAGDLLVADELTVVGATTFTGAVILPTVDVAVTSPTVVNQIVKTSAYVLYISTAVGKVSNWIKIGGQ